MTSNLDFRCNHRLKLFFVYWFLRFDLIYLILDKADEQTDRRLAKHIVSLHFDNPEVGVTFNSGHSWLLLVSCSPFSCTPQLAGH